MMSEPRRVPTEFSASSSQFVSAKNVPSGAASSTFRAMMPFEAMMKFVFLYAASTR
jgi:hypothetical protein